MIPAAILQKNLFVALCECLRWWHWFDGAQRRVIDENGGVIREEDVLRVGKHYGFARNLHSGALGDLVTRLNAVALRPATTLSERAGMLAELITSHRDDAGARFLLVSGTTKLFWFIKPRRWTPFDSYASRAVGANDLDRLARMLSFYRTLDSIGFLEKSNQLTGLVRASGLPSLCGERIFDKLLMMKGGASFSPVATAYAEALPESQRDPLVELGAQISAAADGGLGLELVR